MSLINDALKRAKQAQQAAPAVTAPAPQLLPVERAKPRPRPVPGRRSRTIVPIGLAIVLSLAFFLIWQTRHFEEVDAANAVAARARAADAQKAAVQPLVHPQPPPPAVVPPAPSGVAVSDATPKPADAPAKATSESAPGSVQSSSVAPAVSTVSQTQIAPEPPPLKLQAIIYRPARPSAMINGRPVFVGDEIANWRVLAIAQTSVTLGGGGQTNVLKLAQ